MAILANSNPLLKSFTRHPVIWYLIGIIVFIEVVLRVLNLFIPIGQTENATQTARVEHPIYATSEWGREYWSEFYSLETQERPFVGWGRKEFSGRYINIDKDGRRKTWNPEGHQSKNIFMLGGSALWGTGARDEHTIPSEVSKMLHQSGYVYKVNNYGESGYAFFQEIVNLATLLQKGERPNLVIFYDGLNDVYNTYQAGSLSTIQNVNTAQSSSNTPLGHFRKSIATSLNEYSRIYVLSKEVAGAIRTKSDPRQKFQEAASGYSHSELDKLAETSAEHYINSVNLLDALSKNYGFKYLLFWQPTAYNKSLTELEKSSDPRTQDENLKYLYLATTNQIKKRNPNYFIDLSDALNNAETNYFFDFVHVSEQANDLIAKEMYNNIRPWLR